MTHTAPVQNKAAYQASTALRAFGGQRAETLTHQEQLCFSLVPPDRRSSILDIGIGGGRTTGAVSELFQTYVGIDYSPTLLESAQRQYPDHYLRLMDARALSFEQKFDCVLFSFNGIDVMDAPDRRKCFESIFGALSDGGYFIYSTHSTRCRDANRWANQLLCREIFLSRHMVANLANRLRNFKPMGDVSKADFVFINDPGLYFNLYQAYVNVEKEIEVLKGLGFDLVRTIGNTQQTQGYTEDDGWVYLVLQKGGE